jgi:hypothetical protein
VRISVLLALLVIQNSLNRSQRKWRLHLFQELVFSQYLCIDYVVSLRLRVTKRAVPQFVPSSILWLYVGQRRLFDFCPQIMKVTKADSATPVINVNMIRGATLCVDIVGHELVVPLLLLLLSLFGFAREDIAMSGVNCPFPWSRFTRLCIFTVHSKSDSEEFITSSVNGNERRCIS